MKNILNVFKLGLVLVMVWVFTSGLYAQGALVPQPGIQKNNLIQVAILLDTSGSMSGLIEQAKSALWKMVNELALAKRDGKAPRIEVSLYEYGKSSIAASEGYMRQIIGLTTDLDKISDELFKLNIDGGEEYCGLVIKNAVNDLSWSPDQNVLKIIYIAGNEPFTQGDSDYAKACSSAIKKGIVVNTIFCGTYEEGVQTKWKDGADLADGFYINIDHNRQEVVINAPQDDEIMRLGVELNSTYVAYGAAGAISKGRQEEQDKKAKSANKEMYIQRSLAKASSQYAPAAASWDMVSASESGDKDVSKMDEAELPAELKGKTAEEKKAYVAELGKKRAEIQKKMEKLNAERRDYVAKVSKEKSDENSFDSAVTKSVKKLAEKKKFVFE